MNHRDPEVVLKSFESILRSLDTAGAELWRQLAGIVKNSGWGEGMNRQQLWRLQEIRSKVEQKITQLEAAQPPKGATP